MPPVVVAVGGAALAASAAYTGGIVLFGVTLMEAGLAAAVVAATAVVAVSFVSQALAPKSPDFSLPDLGGFQRENLATIRQSDAPRQLIFGRTRVGGILTFIHSSGTDNADLYLVVTVAGHPVRSFDALLFDGEVIPLDSSGNATGRLAGNVTCKFGLGTTEGDAGFHAFLKAQVPSLWTDDHKQEGCAKAALKMKFDSTKFPSGIPVMNFIVTGYDQVEDPRVGGSPTWTGWTDNAALCLAQYLRESERGLGYGADRIDETALIAAANACDEMVARKALTTRFAAHPASDQILMFTPEDNGQAWDDLAYMCRYPDILGSAHGGTGGGWGGINGNTGAGFQPASSTNGLGGKKFLTANDVAICGSAAIPRGYDHFVYTNAAQNGREATYSYTGAALRCGTRLRVSGSSPPGGLSEGVDYYWIPITPSRGRLATSLANARAGIYIDITSFGADNAFSLTVNAEPRYTLNGVISSDEDPDSVVPQLLAAMAGVKAEPGGVVVLHAGVWRGATHSFGDDDLDGPVTSQHLRPWDQLFNGVKGTFVNPDDEYQPIDFPPVTGAAWLAEDGVRKWRDIQLRFTDSPSMAQRIASIDLELARRQIKTSLPWKLSGMRVRAADNFYLTNEKRGWAAKTFMVAEWSLAIRGSDETTRFGTSVVAQEIDEQVFAWDADAQENTLTPAPRTNLPDGRHVDPPGTPEIEESQYVTRNGAGVKAMATITWPASDDAAFVEHHQVEYRAQSALEAAGGDINTGATWTIVGRTSDLTIDKEDIAPGRYYFRVKAVSWLGVESAYSPLGFKEITGLLAAPAALSGLTISAIGGLAVLRWVQSTDLDVRIGGRIEFRWSPATTGAAWQESVSIGNAVPGPETVALLPLKAGTYLARAYDSSDIPGAVSTVVMPKQQTGLTYTTIATVTEHTGFSGSHDSTRVTDESRLTLVSGENIDDWTDVDTIASWDDGSEVAASGTYTFASVIDLGAVTACRLTSAITAQVVNVLDLIDSRTTLIDTWTDFDGTASADADAQVWVRQSDDAAAGSPSNPTWSDWQRLDSAEFNARSFQFQCRLSSNDNAYNIRVSELSVTAAQVA
jgi:hypothetical protein